MEFLTFLRDEPAMAWLVFLGVLITIVPVASVLWRKMAGRKPAAVAKRPAQVSKPVRFGNQTELFLVLVGILLLLAIVGWLCK